MGTQSRDVQAADRSVDALVKSKAVLDVLAANGPCTAKTISELTGEPVSSTYRLLDNLTAVGWAERGVNRGEYRLGINCVRIGGQIESRLDIQHIARVAFRGHRGQFGVWSLFVRRRLRSVCIETRTREALQSYAQLVGNSLPISVGAPSHVLTSWLGAKRYEQLLEHYAYTNDMGGTFSTMRASAMERSASIRERGFAYDVGETMAGSVTVSVPVFNHAGEIQAAVALSGLSRSLGAQLDRMASSGGSGAGTSVPGGAGPVNEMTVDGTVGLVRSVGAEVSRGMGFSGAYPGIGEQGGRHGAPASTPCETFRVTVSDRSGER